jgi:Spy/CpxP family protein refolding chaperone
MMRAFLSLLLVAPLVAIEAQPTGGGRSGPAGMQSRRPPDQRLQAFVDSMVRVRVAPTDEQFAKMREVATRHERERREIRMQDGRARVELRNLLAATTPNEQRIAELLDQVSKLERQRLDLMEREQRELGKFLSPSQRARYIAMQDELRRNMQDMQRNRLGLDKPEGAGRRGPPEKRPPTR